MKSPICALLGIDFPLFAFSHCRDVVVEVSKAGGMGVFGAVNVRSPDAFEAELKWIIPTSTANRTASISSFRQNSRVKAKR